MNLSQKFPPLYQCEVCGKSVSVKSNGEGEEPTIKRKCSCPENTAILAKRKVTLRGKGQAGFSVAKQQRIKITLTLRQLLSALTGRSI